MKNIPSAEFRTTFQRVSEPVAVTVLGRVIGHYVPVSVAIDDRALSGLRPGEPVSPVVDTRKTQQGERDALLRKINRGT